MHRAPGQRLSFEAEVARYAHHRNRVDDPGYLRFLARLARPMIARLPEGAAGLDYGSGEAPALAMLLSGSGRPTASYDPVFKPDESLLTTTYDFLVCSEVLEHVHEPLPLLERFGTLVRPGGLVGLMTQFYPEFGFGDWWYRRDPTHVCFYSAATMRWIAERLGWSLTVPEPNIAIFTTA